MNCHSGSKPWGGIAQCLHWGRKKGSILRTFWPQAINLNQWWLTWPTHICLIWPRSVKMTWFRTNIQVTNQSIELKTELSGCWPSLGAREVLKTSAATNDKKVGNVKTFVFHRCCPFVRGSDDNRSVIDGFPSPKKFNIAESTSCHGLEWFWNETETINPCIQTERW